MAKRRKKRPGPKPKPVPDPQVALEDFLCGISEATWAAMPDDMLDVVEDAADDLITTRPGLKDDPRQLARLVRRRVRAHRRDQIKAGNVGWEFDQENCTAFMQMLLEFLPLFIALF